MVEGAAPLPTDQEPASARVASVPLWLRHLAALAWRVLVVLALAILTLFIAGVLFVATASVVFASFIAATSAPLHQRFRARGWSRSRAALGTWAASWAVLAAVAVVLAVALVPVAVDVVRAIVAGLQTLRNDLEQAASSPEAASAVERAGVAVQQWIVGGIGGLVANVGIVVSVVILSFFLSFFVILDADHGWRWVSQFVPPKSRDPLERSSRAAVDGVGGFVRDAGIRSGIQAVVLLVVLTVLGVPLAAPLAAIVFLGGFLPYVGTVVTTAVIVLVAYASNGPATALVLLAVVVVLNVVLSRYLERIVPGRPARLHPAIVLGVLLVGATLGGIPGMFAAVPAAALITVLAGPLIDALGSARDLDPDRDPFIPPWLDRLAQWSWRSLVAMGLVLALVLIASGFPFFVGALVMAAVLAATFAPLARALLARGLSPSAAALGATAGTAAVVLVILGITVTALLQQAGVVADAAGAGTGSVDDASGGRLDWLVNLVSDSTLAIVAFVAAAAATLSVLLVAAVLAGIITFFLLRDGAAGWQVLTRRLAGWRRQELDGAAARGVGALGGYMIATGALSAFGAVTQWLVMVVLGIPLATPLAVLAFFLGFIPYFGSFIATGLAFLVTIALGSSQDVVLMAVFTVVFNLVQGSVLGPLVYGKAVSIHPALVLIGVPVGSALAGIVGMFLIIPVFGIIATTWRAVLYVLGDGSDEVPGAVAPPAPAPAPASAPAPAPAPAPVGGTSDS